MESYCSLCTLDTIHRLVFVTRLIINKINKVQWVDFKLENVLVSLHSLKTMVVSMIVKYLAYMNILFGDNHVQSS
jgi:prepilin-type processing-associated H-X9-DG protein